jgi:hypothetical protein
VPRFVARMALDALAPWQDANVRSCAAVGDSWDKNGVGVARRKTVGGQGQTQQPLSRHAARQCDGEDSCMGGDMYVLWYAYRVLDDNGVDHGYSARWLYCTAEENSHSRTRLSIGGRLGKHRVTHVFRLQPSPVGAAMHPLS